MAALSIPSRLSDRAYDAAATPSARTLHWFGDKSREELLLEIDRIITTDRPALAKLYERLSVLEGVARDAIRWTSSSAKGDLTQRLEEALRDE